MGDVLDHARRDSGRVAAFPSPATAHDSPALGEAAKAADMPAEPPQNVEFFEKYARLYDRFRINS